MNRDREISLENLIAWNDMAEQSKPKRRRRLREPELINDRGLEHQQDDPVLTSEDTD